MGGENVTPMEELEEAVADLVDAVNDTFRPVLDRIKRAGVWIAARFT